MGISFWYGTLTATSKTPFMPALALLAGGLLLTPVPKWKVTDEEAIIGTWRAVTLDYGDPKIPQPWGDELPRMTITFKKSGKVRVTLPNETLLDSWLTPDGGFKLDPSANPKAIDLTGGDEKAILGVYELKDDLLTLCVAPQGDKTRPSEFKADPKIGTILGTFKRVKKQDK